MKAEDIVGALMAVLLTIVGGIARLLNVKDKRRIKRRRIVAEIVTAAFMGMMIFILSQLMAWNGWLMFLVAGIAGWIGPQAMDWITKKVGLESGIDMTDKEGPK